MKTLFAFIVTCFFFSETFSQAPVFALPPESYYINRGFNFIQVKDGYLGITLLYNSKKYGNQTNGVAVVNYNNKMVKLGENPLSEGKSVYSDFKPQLVKGNKIWLITGEFANKFGRQGDIRATEIVPETYKEGASKIIVTSDELKELEKHYDVKRVIIKSSPNLKYHCLFYGHPSDEKFFIACLNSDFDPVWKREKQLEKTDFHQVSDVSINDEGEIVTVTIAKSVATITKYDVKGSAVDQQLNFGSAEPAFIDILQSRSGKTYIGGTIFKDSKLQNAVFIANLEKDNLINSIKQLDIPGIILERLAKDGLAKTDDKKNGLTGRYIHSELVEQSDGKIKLVTETTYADKQEPNNNFMGFGGLLITNFSNEENPFSLIPKFVVEMNSWPRINQFVAVPSQNYITVIYSDNDQNINIDLKERQKPLNGRANAALYAATIDNNGVIKRDIFSTMSKDLKGTAEFWIQTYLANKQ